MVNNELPIDQVLPQLGSVLSRTNCVVLQAEPGAGKTTRVPLFLAKAPWLSGMRIIMLEPRRLAAQSAASYMASLLSERVGDTVGYRIRGEVRVSAQTRIEVVTEGILTRYLQSDPSLPDIGLIIFDEFHERSIHADLGLAFALESQRALREDLRIVVMSATLDGEEVARLMGGAPVVTCPGRTYPVRVSYLPHQADPIPFDLLVCNAVRQALRENHGDVLVFLPGRGEILRCQERLLQGRLPEGTFVTPLYSEVGQEAQKRSLLPSPPGTRKIILSTSIAETSITIDGVGVVIDSGLMRVPRYDPRRGMERLDTVPVSLASAEQRKGRAGRTGPGICLRLWTAAEEATLPRFTTPEILTSDLVPLALELAEWGARDGNDLLFLNRPPEAHLAAAQSMLKTLGALDTSGRITEHGKCMSSLRIHPRLAHMLLRAQEIGEGALACDVAALLEERDPLRGGDTDVDLSERWQLLHQFRVTGSCPPQVRTLLARISLQASRLRTALGIEKEKAISGELGILLAIAYPDRIAKRRGPQGRRYLLSSGVGAELPERSLLHKCEYLVIAELDGKAAHARVFLAEPISEEDIFKHFSSHIIKRRCVEWNKGDESVRSSEMTLLGTIILTEFPFKGSADETSAAVLHGIRQMGIDVLPWDRETRAFQCRAEWLRKQGYAPEHWPSLDDEDLMLSIEEWLSPFLNSISKRDELAHIPLLDALKTKFTLSQLSELERLAPPFLVLPTGSRGIVDYGTAGGPSMSVLLQEMFGQKETPRIAEGRVPITVQFLSPARRPLQVTRDLASFWANAYKDVRKEMLSRYPKHHWPEDPLSAAPTRHPKRRITSR